MKERKIFYKQLTPAELGEAKTHEKYIRFPNDFDYKSFFGIDAVKNESVLQLDIDARYNGNPEDIVPLKFVYYANSNKEKRMPSLGPVFEKYQVKAGSIFALEVISDNGNSVIDVSFKKANELKLFTNPVCYTEIVKDTVSPHADIVIDRKKGRDAVIQDLSKAKTNYSPSALSTSYLTAMRTKPFLLLAGISGTGKSRIVKQMAFESCPDIPALRSDKTAPGNYELIEVKPNWHDSSELLGYESEIGGPHYVVTPFVRFLVKAMRYPDVPFFVCMDEMNLAPVEQYFAEFLSVLESRKLLSDGTITSEPLIKADIFSKYADQLHRDLDITDTETYKTVYDRLKNDGLRLPSNLIVVGTVNMDETTHQFSRKVIDRAMTIEMNIEDAETPFKNFFEGGDALHYYDNPQPKDLFLPKVVQASEALSILDAEDASYLKENVPRLLHSLNSALNGTPFKIAYRVQNELILYFFSLREENSDEASEVLLAQAMDAILMTKVLPRIEGDEDLLDKPLKALAQFTENYPQASRKIAEMQERLPQAHFTCFWP
jgi:5-methylcytosine-specific restriction endonuclease McrBC GTP-binding regulatory subunit McrB